ncbi:methyl-accepting chemotaxis protein, partial [Pseudomonas syringae pv. tagetis]
MPLNGLAGPPYLPTDPLRTAQQNIEENTLPSIKVVDDIQIPLLHDLLESITMQDTTHPPLHITAQP